MAESSKSVPAGQAPSQKYCDEAYKLASVASSFRIRVVGAGRGLASDAVLLLEGCEAELGHEHHLMDK